MSFGHATRSLRVLLIVQSSSDCVIGAVLGMTVGLLLAALVTHALSGEGLEFSIPAGTLVAFLIVAIVGMLAAILPARRASRLNVLQALQYE